VVNGTQYHAPTLDALRRDRRVRYIYREKPGLPEALVEGRRAVDTEFFCVLDDDDIYLPNALSTRLRAISLEPRVDVVVTNGFDLISGRRVLKIASLMEAASDPAGFLMRYNWLASAAALFRTESVPAEVLSEMPPVAEWTYLALKLCLTSRVRFVDEPTYVITVGSAESVSASHRYLQLQPSAIKKMMDLPVSGEIRRALRSKLASAFHELADHSYAEGSTVDAWRHHIACVAYARGWRHILFTRKLLIPKL
jgi:glycosyltransferase involved in cell wall biosynthesis